MHPKIDYVIDRTARRIPWHRKVDWEAASLWFLFGTANTLFWAIILTLLGVW